MADDRFPIMAAALDEACRRERVRLPPGVQRRLALTLAQLVWPRDHDIALDRADDQ